MRVDISQETDAGDAVLEFPWADSSNPQRTYVDLKAQPEAVANLEECRRYPALGELLRLANSPASILRSVKCDVWQTSELAEDEQLDFDLPFKVGSYVDFILDAHESRERLETHQRCAEIIAERVREVKVQAQLEIFVRRCLFRPEDVWGYYLTVFTHAYGATAQEADSQWVAALRGLADALTHASRELRGIEGGAANDA